MRQLIIDTETTGLDPKGGHRIIEFAALELVPGTQDQARAREYAARYAERLHGDGENR